MTKMPGPSVKGFKPTIGFKWMVFNALMFLSLMDIYVLWANFDNLYPIKTMLYQ